MTIRVYSAFSLICCLFFFWKWNFFWILFFLSLFQHFRERLENKFKYRTDQTRLKLVILRQKGLSFSLLTSNVDFEARESICFEFLLSFCEKSDQHFFRTMLRHVWNKVFSEPLIPFANIRSHIPFLSPKNFV